MALGGWRNGTSGRQLVVRVHLGRVSVGVVGSNGRRQVTIETGSSAVTMALLGGAVNVGVS